MKKLFLLLPIISLLIGCATRKEITNYSDIRDDKPDKLIIFLKDSSLITLNSYSLEEDSLIIGKGTVEKNGLIDFNGKIKLSDINYLAGESSSGFKGLITIALIGATAAVLLSEYNINKGVGYELKFPEGGSSCPFLYSLNGNGYQLEGEAFGTGLGRGMETSTSIVLKNIDYSRPEMNVRFTNERPETHYFNNIEVVAIEHEINSEIIADNNENYIPIYSKINPLSANANGHDILSYINKNDKKYWEENLTPAKGNKDTIYLTFDNNTMTSSGTLIVDAINTYFGTYTYYYLNNLLGDKYLEFMNCIETDSSLIYDLKDYLKESSLMVEVYNGKEWDNSGYIKPEANFTSFTKGLSFKIPQSAGKQVKLRMIALKDVWKIDNICCDFSKKNEPAVHSQKIITAIKNDHENILNNINTCDNSYCVLLPNDKLDIKFQPQAPSEGNKITYAIKSTGYLQPWTWKKNQHLELVNLSKENRIGFIKSLIKNRDFFLPLIYAEWQKEKYLFKNQN
jgi:hypothetical protein